MSITASIVSAGSVVFLLLSALVCLCGLAVAVCLLVSARPASGRRRLSWQVLAAIEAGTALWAAYFILPPIYPATIAPQAFPAWSGPVLLFAIAVSFLAIRVAMSPIRFASLVGGGAFGLAAGATYFLVVVSQGDISWSAAPVMAAYILTIAGSIVGFWLVGRAGDGHAASLGGAVLGLSCAILPLSNVLIADGFIPGLRAMPIPASSLGLAVMLAGLSFLVFGMGLMTYYLEHRARRDMSRHLYDLTRGASGLSGSAAFAEQASAQFSANKTLPYAVVLIDIDDFGLVNHVHGHVGGDRVLQEVVARLQCVLAPEELLVRIGGDEFVVLAPLTRTIDATRLIERLQGVFAPAVAAPGGAIILSASYGIALRPQDGDSIEDLLDKASLALRRIKGGPGEQLGYYRSDLDEVTRQNRGLAGELSQAIEKGQFELHYQVQKLVRTGRIIGYESLVRWRHPTRGLLPPGEFVPVAEETGLIMRLGQYVLRMACMEAAGWQYPHKIAVNASVVQLLDPEFVQILEQVLTETGLAPARLEIEVTESTLMADPIRSARVLTTLRAIGVSIAMDDFGTGYSSLASLNLFAFDRIKLDKSFISELEQRPQARAIVRAVLALGKSLGIPVLAEGVERETQLTFLAEEGCDEAQGFLLGRPSLLIALPGPEPAMRNSDPPASQSFS